MRKSTCARQTITRDTHLIRVPVLRDELAHQRYHIEGVLHTSARKVKQASTTKLQTYTHQVVQVAQPRHRDVAGTSHMQTTEDVTSSRPHGTTAPLIPELQHHEPAARLEDTIRF